MLRVCIASIQNVERSLLLLVVSSSDIPLRTIKFFSVLFSSAWRRGLVVGRRICDLVVAGSRPGRDAAAQQP